MKNLQNLQNLKSLLFIFAFAFVSAFVFLVFSSSVDAIPVSYKITVNYSGDITAGHVLKADSSSRITSKTINANFSVINHVANEGEIVSFFLDNILFNNYSQPLPGSIVDLGFHNIEAPPVISDAGGGNSGGGGGGGTSGATVVPDLTERETLEETLKNAADVAAAVDFDIENEVAAVSVVASEGDVKTFSIIGSAGGGGSHTITIDSVLEDKATFTIASSPKKITLFIGESKNLDVDDDFIEDISITLNSITGKSVDMSIRNLIRNESAKDNETASGLSKITGAVIGALGSKAAIYTYVIVAVLFLLAAAIVQLGGIYGIRRRLRREKKFPKVDYL